MHLNNGMCSNIFHSVVLLSFVVAADYTLTPAAATSVTILAGAIPSSDCVTVDAVDDLFVEGAERFTFTITSDDQDDVTISVPSSTTLVTIPANDGTLSVIFGRTINMGYGLFNDDVIRSGN